jgi:hypothetical protein
MYKLLFASLLLLFFFPLESTASGEFRGAGARSVTMGGASVGLSDFWSLSNNQAGIPFLRGSMAGIFAESCYLPGDMTTSMLGAFYSTKPAHFGIMVLRTGNNLYNEIRAGLSVSRKFGKYFSAAIQADYLRIQQSEGYPSANRLSFEAGLMFRAGKNWTAGFHIINPVPVRIPGDGSDLLPAIIRFGGCYSTGEKFLLSLECEKDLLNPPIIKGGLEYWFFPGICGRAGVSTNPTTVAAGFGFKWKNWVIDIGSSYHFILGYSPVVSITYQIKE